MSFGECPDPTRAEDFGLP